MVSGVLTAVSLIAVSYVIGRLIQKVIHKTQQGVAHAFVAGSFAVLFLAYLFQILLIALGRPFSFMKTGLTVSCAALFFAGIIVVRRGLLPERIRARKGAGQKTMILSAVIALLFFLCAASVQVYEPYFGNDMTVETAETTLATGTVCRFHPATGTELEYGMTALSKCNAMPQFYAVLCALSGASAYPFICRVIPVWGLLLNVCACSVLMGAVGLKDEKKQYALLFYLLLVLMGDGRANDYAFRLLHQGFSPYTVFLGTGGMALLALAATLAGKLAAAVHKKGGARHG